MGAIAKGFVLGLPAAAQRERRLTFEVERLPFCVQQLALALGHFHAIGAILLCGDGHSHRSPPSASLRVSGASRTENRTLENPRVRIAARRRASSAPPSLLSLPPF